MRNRASTTIMHEKEYNNLQPTYTYPLPLVPTAAPVPGSIFNRHGGSKSNRRGHYTIQAWPIHLKFQQS